MKWNLYLNFLAAMLSIINPIGILPLWTELTGDRTKNIRKQIAFLVTGISLIIALVFLITGKYVLNFFSIDIPVFRIAGGILLLFTGISMMKGSATKLQDREEDGESDYQLAKKRFRKIFVPMAIPTLAGPGTITTVILFGSSAESFVDYLILSAIVILTLFILYLMFRNSSLIEAKVDKMIFIIFTRIFGIIVTAIALQFMLEGLAEVFPNWVEGASELEKGKENSSSSR